MSNFNAIYQPSARYYEPYNLEVELKDNNLKVSLKVKKQFLGVKFYLHNPLSVIHTTCVCYTGGTVRKVYF